MTARRPQQFRGWVDAEAAMVYTGLSRSSLYRLTRPSVDHPNGRLRWFKDDSGFLQYNLDDLTTIMSQADEGPTRIVPPQM